MPRGVNRYDEAAMQLRLWSPEQLGPKVWLDSQSPGAFTIVSSAVSEWKDRSGNGNHATQPTSGKRPVIAGNSINSLSAVRFDGADDWMTITGCTFAQSPFSVYMVHALRSLRNMWPVLWGESSGSTNGPFAIGMNNGFFGNQIAIHRVGVQTVSSDLTSGTVPRILSWRSAGIVSGGCTVAVRRSGTPSSSPITIASGIVSGADITIAAERNGAASFTDSDIGEVLQFGAEHSLRETQLVEGYLAWKWGMTTDLPASHPFANRPPLIGD